jgi:hypothetical protein
MEHAHLGRSGLKVPRLWLAPWTSTRRRPTTSSYQSTTSAKRPSDEICKAMETAVAQDRTVPGRKTAPEHSGL